MKNYTLCVLVALVFALCAEHTSAQTFYSYSPHNPEFGMKQVIEGKRTWVFDLEGRSSGYYQPAPFWGTLTYCRYGPGVISKVMEYSFSTPRVIQLYTNGSPYYAPNWQPYVEYMLVGDGIDSLFFELSTANSNGWGGQARILNEQYTLLETIPLFQTAYPAASPVINVNDPYNGTPPSISYTAQVVQQYFPGNGSYTMRMYAKLTRIPQPGYQQTHEFVFPLGTNPVATFSLPFNFNGEYCLQWRYTVEHLSSTPKCWSGELEVWRYEPPCFFLGTTGLEDYDKTSYQVYPNPWKDVLYVASPHKVGYQVLEPGGRLVHQDMLNQGVNVILDLGETFSPGVYILRTDDGYFTRLVKE